MNLLLLFKINFVFIFILAFGCCFGINADKLCSKENITLKECINEMKEAIQLQSVQIKKDQEALNTASDTIRELKNTILPGPWYDLILPPNWSLHLGQSVQCRRNGDWIEFKGLIVHPQMQGWPAATHNMLPKTCRPDVRRHTVMFGHVTMSGVGIYEFWPNGDISFYTNQPSDQQHFEGLRIWGGK